MPVIRSENGETLESAVVQSKVKTDPLNLNAHAAVLLDGDTGRILYGKNEKKVLPMASTTKIMTCILALENSGLDTEVEISDRAASMPEVKLHAGKGEKYRLEDLLYSLMLESHNDTAVAIAEAVGGSVENFADMMNGKAAELGCDDTYFLTGRSIPRRRQTWRGSSDIVSHSPRRRKNSLPSQEHRPTPFLTSPERGASPVSIITLS